MDWSTRDGATVVETPRQAGQFVPPFYNHQHVSRVGKSLSCIQGGILTRTHKMQQLGRNRCVGRYHGEERAGTRTFHRRNVDKG
jgi:hypothetical protein